MKKSIFSLILAAGLSTSAFAGGADPDLTLTVAGATTGSGAAFDSAVTFDNVGPSDVDGWSFGVCHDNTALTLNSATAGAATIGLNGGGALGFESIEMPADGYTVGVVIDFFGANKLAPGSGYELMVGNYTNNQAPMDSTGLAICSTLGMPAVDSVIVIGGASIVPMTVDGTVDTVAGPPPFAYIAGNANVNYDGNSGAASGNAVIDLSIEENAGNPGYPNDTQGFSLDIENDMTYLSPNSIDATSELNDLNGGMGPSFISPSVEAAGVTLGVVYQFLGGVFIQFDVAKVVATVDYSVDASSLAGDPAGATAALTWGNNLGMPPVENVVVVGGASIAPEFVDGAVTLTAVFDTPFVRGDCNGDLSVDIADGIWILNELFQGGTAGGCAEACNANGDGTFDQSDAVFVFTYRFLDGPAPAAPFPACDTVAGADCDSSPCP